MVAREGIEPPTRGFSAQRSSATGASKPKTGKGVFRDGRGRPEPPTLFRTPAGRSEGPGEEPRSASTSCAGSDRTGAERRAANGNLQPPIRVNPRPLRNPTAIRIARQLARDCRSPCGLHCKFRSSAVMDRRSMNLAKTLFPDAEYEVEFYWPHKLGVVSRRMLLPGAAILVLLFGVGPWLLTLFIVQRGKATVPEVAVGLVMFSCMTLTVIYITYVHFKVRHAFHERCWLGSKGVRVRHASGLETTIAWSECTSARLSVLARCLTIHSPRLQLPVVVFHDMWTTVPSLPVRLWWRMTGDMAMARAITEDHMGDRFARTL
jgi:hypothetical protein